MHRLRYVQFCGWPWVRNWSQWRYPPQSVFVGKAKPLLTMDIYGTIFFSVLFILVVALLSIIHGAASLISCT